MFNWKTFGLSKQPRDQGVATAPAGAPETATAAAQPVQKSAKALFDEGRTAFHDAGDHDRALALLREALARFDTDAERDEQLAAVSCNDIGLMLKLRGELAEAEAMFRRASEFFERVHGLAHHDTATTMHNLGATLLQRGRIEQGGLLLTRSFELICRLHSNDKIDVLHAHQHQGILQRARGFHAQAAGSYRAAFEVGQSFLAPDHHEMLSLMRDVATEFGETGETGEALGWWKKLADAAPADSQDAADAWLEIGHAERGLSHAPAALEAYRRAGAIYSRLAGPLSERRVRAALGEAMALVASGEDQEAGRLLELLVTRLRHGGQASRWLFGEAASEFGEFLTLRGRLVQARGWLEAARDALEAELGPTHHLTCEAVARLARVLERTGDGPGAETLYRSVIRGVESWKECKEGWVATYGDRIATLCHQRKAYAEAEVWLRRAIRNAEVAWGPQAGALAGMQYRLGAVLEAQGARDAAWSALMQALGVYRRKDALDADEVADILRRLVRMIRTDAEPHQVQTFLRDLISSLESAYPENHPNVAFLYRAMGESLVAQEQPQAALPWLERALAMTICHYGLHRDEVAVFCRVVEDARNAAAAGPLRPWTAGLPPAGETTTWQLRVAYPVRRWEGVANFAQHHLEDACETWLADLDQYDDWNDIAGPVAKYEAHCGTHEHLVVVSTDALVISVMGEGSAGLDSRLVDLETRLLLALARCPEIVIEDWTLSAGAAGAQQTVAAGDAAALVGRLAPPGG